MSQEILRTILAHQAIYILEYSLLEDVVANSVESDIAWYCARNVGTWLNFLFAVTTPIFHSLVALVAMRPYRKAVLTIFGCKKKKATARLRLLTFE